MVLLTIGGGGVQTPAQGLRTPRWLAAWVSDWLAGWLAIKVSKRRLQGSSGRLHGVRPSLDLNDLLKQNKGLFIYSLLH